jgi:hypothetical protein
MQAIFVSFLSAFFKPKPGYVLLLLQPEKRAKQICFFDVDGGQCLSGIVI